MTEPRGVHPSEGEPQRPVEAGLPVPRQYYLPVPPASPPPGPPPPGRFTAWWSRPSTVAGVIALLVLLVVALVVVTLRGRGGGAEPAALASPSASAVPTHPADRPTDDPPTPTAAPTGATPAPSGPPLVLPPAPAGPGETYQTGSHEAFEDSSLDLDDNYYSFTANEDVAVLLDGLGGNDGSLFAPWPGPNRPLLQDCAARPVTEWAPYVPKASLKAGAFFCVISDDQRYGYLLVQRVAVTRQGDLDRVAMTFLLWKKGTDR